MNIAKADELTQKLVDMAIDASRMAYAPYSNYRVGAALLCEDGEIFTGCNIENSSYSLTCCAERTAFFKAVSCGRREFTAIAISGFDKDGKSESYCTPCGACRQVMSEFCGEDFTVICIKDRENYKMYKLSELIPYAFSADNIK